MTRRERLERKLEKRREWADKAAARSDASFAGARDAVAGIPPGQPILVGHHSERRHRAALDRHDSRMRKGVAEADKASHHASKADGIERQLDESIFSDDPDAIEQLEAKIAALEAKRARWKKWNAHWRKHKTMKGAEGVSDEEAARLDAEIPQRYSWERQPIAKYQLSNLGGVIRNAKQRIEQIRTRQDRSAAAEAAGGVAVERIDTYARVTFAEKPERAILDELKAAGFRWGGGSWVGQLAKLPARYTEDA